MTTTKPLRIALPVLGIWLFAATASAQVDPVTIYDPMPNITAILGAAQMDGDPADEIALVYGDERIIIVDSASGSVEFDSDSYGWSYVYPPAYNLRNVTDLYAGYNYGFDVFCDEDGDGVYCLMILISELTIYEKQLAVICLGGGVATLQSPGAPVGARLEQNTPNPFNPNTEIAFSLDRAGRTDLRIFDVKGREVRRLFSGELPAGTHVLTWDGTDNDGRGLASGTYFYQLNANGRASTRKSLLLK